MTLKIAFYSVSFHLLCKKKKFFVCFLFVFISLVVERFRIQKAMLQKNVPFDEWFRVEAVQQYHRALTAETFMRDLAPTVWPEGKRIGWCWLPQKKNDGETYCPMKEGNGHAFWNMF